jgi:hypothetical protein
MASTVSRPCSAKTAADVPCQAWARRGYDPPLCAAHSTNVGAPIGNTNAVKHGFYRRSLHADEISDLLTFSQAMTLEDELAITRVMLQRLMLHLKSNELTTYELAALGPLVFTGERTVAHLLRDIGDSGPASIWDEVLDHMSAELGIVL